ncbi:unnamed protein product (macronuclear) [Paramecium tetraurelia]|uniref:Centrosomal protein of 162 kDa n=1 Tax=Paramecium tetraurelia TaxID=5888 RepID=A0BQG5_PARTE|nr:uncharacterized protein GSPATT00031011001 [Paramecium tetraurelia]CAK60782.1 unnamed protein product [Paramecium tetraurelia]|eukprot:XP_001428180.1 hypothetical protein (macronuclear) [Paramecium tetraurelia strain d4-2]
MNERESRMSLGAFASNPTSASQNAYAQALKALQDKLKGVEGLKNEGLKKSIENPSEYFTDQLKKQIYDLQNENERLQYLLTKTNQESQRIHMPSQFNDLPQTERLQHVKDYQDRLSDMIIKYEELKHEKQEIQMANENLLRQLSVYKQNDKGVIPKTKYKKIDDNIKQTVQDLKTKLDIKDQQLKISEKKLEYLEMEKEQVLQEFTNYKSKYPPMKLHDFEKQIHSLKQLLEEKDKQHVKTIDEIERNKSAREEQMSRRIQDLIGKCNEYQQIIEQLTQDYKDLSLKYQQVKIKLDYQERQHRYINRKYSQGELKQGYKEQKNITRMDMSPPLSSSRLEQSQLKQAIRECLEDMMNTQNYNQSSQDRRSENRKQQQILSPMSTSRQQEIESQLKELNEKYENLMSQAQKENDLNSKAVIRKQLIEIAGQIKETTKFEKS